MFKLGVYRLDQFQAEFQSGGWWKLRNQLSGNRIAFPLFRTQIPATAKEIALFEQVIPLVRLSSGVYRTTFRGRFGEFDTELNQIIAGQFDSAAPLKVEDWAASDCLASSEWAASLFARFPAATLTASDLTLHLIEVCLPGGESFVIETNGEPLQYIRPPFVIRLSPPEPRLLAVNSFLEARARSKLRSIRNSWKLTRQWLESEDSETFEQAPYVFRKIPLIHPDAQALRLASDRFAIRQHSVFEAAERPCDVIRTMNIFNLAYFSKEKLLEGVSAVWRSLRPNGVWILGRTIQEKPPVHHASMFVREPSGFRLLQRFGPGSEIEGIVLTGRIP